jgi:hypothetical protein
MEARLGISLHSYPYLKLTKMLCHSYYLLYVIINKLEQQECGTDSAQKQEGRGKRKGCGAGRRNSPNNVYTYK